MGQLFAALERRATVRTVGILGLGAGTMACYRRPGQTWIFFEIDPLVEKFARDTPYFHYMSDCAGDTKVGLGDGRLSLTREPDGRFDLLIMDAFSSDSVPMHLMTREALALYMAKLADDGILVFNISNRNMDFSPMLGNLVAAAGLSSRLQRYKAGNRDYRKTYKVDSEWVVIARPAPGPRLPRRQPGLETAAPRPRQRTVDRRLLQHPQRHEVPAELRRKASGQRYRGSSMAMVSGPRGRT